MIESLEFAAIGTGARPAAPASDTLSRCPLVIGVTVMTICLHGLGGATLEYDYPRRAGFRVNL